jgi:hypothetical protein
LHSTTDSPLKDLADLALELGHNVTLVGRDQAEDALKPLLSRSSGASQASKDERDEQVLTALQSTLIPPPLRGNGLVVDRSQTASLPAEHGDIENVMNAADVHRDISKSGTRVARIGRNTTSRRGRAPNIGPRS